MPQFARKIAGIAALFLVVVANLFAAEPAMAAVDNQYYIPLGTLAHPDTVAFSDDGRYVYTTSEAAHKVFKIDVATHAIVDEITLASVPRGIAVSPDSSTLWVTIQGAYPTVPSDGGVVGVDASTMTISAALVPLPYHDGTVDYTGVPAAIILNAAGTKAYVLGGASGELYEVDLVSHTLTQHVQVTFDDSVNNDIARNLAITPDGSKIFVTSHVETSSLPAENQVFSVPANNFAGFSVITPGSYNFVQPNGVAVSPDGRYLYVTDAADYQVSPTNGDNYVYVLDAHTEQFITRFIANSSLPQPSNNFVAVSADSSQFVVMDSHDWGTLEFYDARTNTQLYSYSLGNSGPSFYTANPNMFAINKAGTMIAIALTGDDGMALLDLNPSLLAPPEDSLSHTGSNIEIYLYAGFVLVLMGAALFMWSRKFPSYLTH